MNPQNFKDDKGVPFEDVTQISIVHTKDSSGDNVTSARIGDWMLLVPEHQPNLAVLTYADKPGSIQVKGEAEGFQVNAIDDTPQGGELVEAMFVPYENLLGTDEQVQEDGSVIAVETSS